MSPTLTTSPAARGHKRSSFQLMAKHWTSPSDGSFRTFLTGPKDKVPQPPPIAKAFPPTRAVLFQPAPQRQPVHVGRAQTAGRAAVLRSARRASSPIRLRAPLILRPRVTASEQVRLLPAANWSAYAPNEYREAFPKAGETRPKARSKATSQRPAPRHRSRSKPRASVSRRPDVLLRVLRLTQGC